MAKRKQGSGGVSKTGMIEFDHRSGNVPPSKTFSQHPPPRSFPGYKPSPLQAACDALAGFEYTHGNSTIHTSIAVLFESQVSYIVERYREQATNKIHEILISLFGELFKKACPTQEEKDTIIGYFAEIEYVKDILDRLKAL
jgi:hypothetical protein